MSKEQNIPNHSDDLELLLLHKEYHELNAEEKSFVSELIPNEKEYNELRNTILLIRSELDNSPQITPRSSTKNELLKKLENAEGETTVLPHPEKVKSNNWMKWLIPMGTAASIILAFFLFEPDVRQAELAERIPKKENKSSKSVAEKSSESELEVVANESDSDIQTQENTASVEILSDEVEMMDDEATEEFDLAEISIPEDEEISEPVASDISENETSLDDVVADVPASENSGDVISESESSQTMNQELARSTAVNSFNESISKDEGAAYEYPDAARKNASSSIDLIDQLYTAY